MKFLEKDLETIIYESDKQQLGDRGLHLYGRLFRQLRIGNYGISDLICVEKRRDVKNGRKYLHIQVLEMKKDCINKDTFLQALRYAKGIQSYLHNREFISFTIELILIGNDVDKSDGVVYVPDLFHPNREVMYGGISELHFLTYHYELTGLRFNEVYGFSLINEGFKINSNRCF